MSTPTVEMFSPLRSLSFIPSWPILWAQFCWINRHRYNRSVLCVAIHKQAQTHHISPVCCYPQTGTNTTYQSSVLLPTNRHKHNISVQCVATHKQAQTHHISPVCCYPQTGTNTSYQSSVLLPTNRHKHIISVLCVAIHKQAQTHHISPVCCYPSTPSQLCIWLVSRFYLLSMFA